MTEAHDDQHDESGSAAASQYFNGDPAVASDPITVDVTLADTAFTLQTDRGVFSRGHLDDGTSLLLRTPLPVASSGHLLDIGCGAGPIALTMARRSPDAQVWAIDVNTRARALCIDNARRNGIDNVTVCSPDSVPTMLEFATIWSNPPIRVGKAALHDLISKWLSRMASDGTAAFVVQKHLGADSLQRWLDNEGHATERVASKSGFRVLSVRRAPDRPRS